MCLGELTFTMWRLLLPVGLECLLFFLNEFPFYCFLNQMIHDVNYSKRDFLGWGAYKNYAYN